MLSNHRCLSCPEGARPRNRPLDPLEVPRPDFQSFQCFDSVLLQVAPPGNLPLARPDRRELSLNQVQACGEDPSREKSQFQIWPGATPAPPGAATYCWTAENVHMGSKLLRCLEMESCVVLVSLFEMR